jgi:hypothetical protein
VSAKSWYRQPEDSFAYKWGRFWSRAVHAPGKALEWLRVRTINRYHILDLRHGDYRGGWMDAPQKMEAALFACLVFFVEKEEAFGPDPIVDWDHDQEHRAVRGKALELYRWWTKGQHEEAEFLACITKDLDDPFTFKDILEGPHKGLSEMIFTEHPRWDQYRYWSDRFEAKRERMFRLLVDIRHYLWT